MTFKLPTINQMRSINDDLGLKLDDNVLAAMQEFLKPFAEGFNLVGMLADDLPPVKYPRTPGYRPEGDENRYGAWAVKTTIKGASRGRLRGKQVAIKDTMCIAGVPLMNGASILEGYIPEIDATVVTRLLDAGAEIIGKTVCEYFSFAGNSCTSSPGPVDNPRNPGHTPGGSSTGSAAVVAAGEVEMAMGGDQAGSIRVPSSYSGIVGIKPTFGLVPYTGVMSVDASIDHTGPMTAGVAHNAMYLEILAGPDGYDARQGAAKAKKYTKALDQGAGGLKIAAVSEGFGHEDSEPGVDATVRKAAKRFENMGATVSEVSIPWHNFGPPIWGAITLEGTVHTMLLGNGFGRGTEGVYWPSMIKAMAECRSRAAELPYTVATVLVMGYYADQEYRGHYYAKGQNLRRRLRAAYDAVLADHDLLLLPTTRMTTSRIPEADAPYMEVMKRSWENISNTCPFNVTGHPAISVPCGLSKEKPVGMMLIAKHWDEPRLYQAAHTFEQSGDWTKMGAASHPGS